MSNFGELQRKTVKIWKTGQKMRKYLEKRTNYRIFAMEKRTKYIRLIIEKDKDMIKRIR